jgi:hypothetical protein
MRIVRCLACAFAVGWLMAPGAVVAQQKPADQKGKKSAAPKTPPPAAKAPAPPPSPQISAAGMRIIAAGLGANGSELHAFNEQSGTSIALGVQMPPDTALIEIDRDGSRIDAFTDDKGRNLLEEGRFSAPPKLSDDRSAALVEVSVRTRPSAGASSVCVQGTIAMTMASAAKATRVSNVRLETGRSIKLGAGSVIVKRANVTDEGIELVFALPQAVLPAIKDIRFFDSKGAPLDSVRTGSGVINDSAQIELTLKSKATAVAIDFNLWQNLRPVKTTFNVTAGLGFGDAK